MMDDFNEFLNPFRKSHKLMTTAVISGSAEDYAMPPVRTTYYAADQHGPFVVSTAKETLHDDVEYDEEVDDSIFAEFMDVFGVGKDEEIEKAIELTKEQFPNRAVHITITNVVDSQMQMDLQEIFSAAT